MNKFSCLVLVLLLILTGSACKPRHTVLDGGHSAKGTGAEVIKGYTKSTLRFDNLSLKGKGSYTNPEDKSSFTFTYRINIQRDSLIWASISKFGFEGMRILASRDSVWVRRMDVQEGTRCDFSYIRKTAGMEIDFSSLQSFLLGEVVGSPDSLRYVDATRNPYQFHGNLGNYHVNWFLDGRSYKVVKADAAESGAEKASNFVWSDFRLVGDQSFAHLLTVDVLSPKPLHLEMTHNSVELDGGNANFNFSFPDNYTIKNCNEK
jgi:hypothetical protein